MPGDYVQNSIAGNAHITAESKQQMIESYGLEVSAIEGYFRWISNGLRGYWGISFLYKAPVSKVIGSVIITTLIISISSLILQVIVALFLGIKSAFKRNKKLRFFVGIFSTLSISVPVFFVALLLQKWLSLNLGLFPLQGHVSLKYEYTGLLYAIDILKHMALPILTLALTGIGGTARYIKQQTEAILATDYVLAAVARGYGQNEIIRYQILPNIRILLAVIIGKEIPFLLTKTLIIEEIFALNGVGTVVFAGLAMGDLPLIMGFSMLIALVVVICALGEDLIYVLSDPRIRLGKGAVDYE